MAPQKRRGPTATSMPAAKTSQKRRGPTAKSLAVAKTRVKNGKRKERRSAVEELNVLAQEVGAGHAKLLVKSVIGSELEHLVKVLEPRCQSATLQQRLRAAVKKWHANGGKLTPEVSPPPDLNSPGAVPGRTRVQSNFG